MSAPATQVTEVVNGPNRVVRVVEAPTSAMQQGVSAGAMPTDVVYRTDTEKFYNERVRPHLSRRRILSCGICGACGVLLPLLLFLGLLGLAGALVATSFRCDSLGWGRWCENSPLNS